MKFLSGGSEFSSFVRASSKVLSAAGMLSVAMLFVATDLLGSVVADFAPAINALMLNKSF